MSFGVIPAKCINITSMQVLKKNVHSLDRVVWTGSLAFVLGSWLLFERKLSLSLTYRGKLVQFESVKTGTIQLLYHAHGQTDE